LVSWQYRGLERIQVAGAQRDFKSYTLELWRGLKARIPLTAAVEPPPRLTRSKMIGPAMPPADSYTGGDRAVRLANVIISWGYLKYFHPQLRTIEFEWNNALVRALQQAAVDKSGDDFAGTLREMLRQTDDAQATVSFQPKVARGVLPVQAEWIDGRLIQRGGDEIISIDNKPAAILFEECRKRYLSNAASKCVIEGPWSQPATLEIRPAGSQTHRPIQMTYAAGQLKQRLKLEEVSPAVWYVDMTRMTDHDWAEALPKLETARGIVFDLRGSMQFGPEWLGHLSASSLLTKDFQIPIVDGPDLMRFESLPALELPAIKPLLNARKVFLVDSNTVGASERMLHEIATHKLGETVGEPTAGAPGDSVSILLPGNYRISWTGTKPARPIGIIETMTMVVKSVEGVSAGIDEVLSRALALIPKVL